MTKIIVLTLAFGILGLLRGMLGRDQCPPPPCYKKVAVIQFMPVSSRHLR